MRKSWPIGFAGGGKDVRVVENWRICVVLVVIGQTSSVVSMILQVMTWHGCDAAMYSCTFQS